MAPGAFAILLTLSAALAAPIQPPQTFDEAALRRLLLGALSADQVRGLGQNPPLENVVALLNAAQKQEIGSQLYALEVAVTTRAELAQIIEGYRLLGKRDEARNLAGALNSDVDWSAIRRHHLMRIYERDGNYAAMEVLARRSIAEDPYDPIAKQYLLMSKGRVSERQLPVEASIISPQGSPLTTSGGSASPAYQTVTQAVARGLKTNLPLPPSPSRGFAHPSNSPAMAALAAAAGATGATLLLFGLGGEKVEERVPGIKLKMGATVAVAGALTYGVVYLFPQLTAASSNPATLVAAGRAAQTDSRAVNEVPRTFARVIPYTGVRPATFSLEGRTHAFVTAAEDVAGLNGQQISERLGIQPSSSYLIIRFPACPPGTCTPMQFADPKFIGRGLTSGGAREFWIPNGPIPKSATYEVIQWLESPLTKKN